MKTLLKADLIVCEFWPWGMRRMGLSPEPVFELATRFPFAQVLPHDQPAGEPRRTTDAVLKLRTLIDDGGEFAQADLILTRDEHQVTTTG